MVDTATNKGEVIETEVSNWLEKVEQMEGDITNFLNQPGDGESFRCFQGCMCPNLMWRYKRGRKAKKKKLDVSELISKGELLQTSPVARNESFQSELHFDSSPYYTTFQSRASVVDKIQNALKDSGVDVIGVHGPGGAGKTTMVTEVAKEAKKLGIFDKFAIAVVSKDLDTSKLQEELASQLDFKYEQICEIGKADELRKALLNSKRKILVILDDLWQVLDLNAIGIPISGLGDRGFKILLTSRNEEVFRGMEVRSCVRLEYLEEQETWELFKKVIDGDFPVDESTARMVSKRCGDLPVAIVAVGAALKGKDDYVWCDALNQLKSQRVKYIEGKVLEGYTPLKLSYDFLEEEDAKSCFLLCCLFPEDAEIPIDDLVRYSFALGFLSAVSTLKDARYRVQTMVNMLKRSCLLLNGENKNFVKMHDVIRDIAISITKERQIEHDGGLDWPGQQHFMVDHNIRKWPKNDAWEHYTAISLMINDADIHIPYCPLMQTLVLKRGKRSPGIPNDFFLGMKAARVLDLENIYMDIPSSVLELDQLRMLRLKNCRYLGDLSTIRNLKNHIEILSLLGSTIEKLPQEIGNLTRLRSLDLRVSLLRVIPKGVISNLIHLEELYVTRSFKNWDTTTDRGMSNASIGELKSLNQLTILHVGISTNSYRIMVQECRHLFEKLINFVIFINYHSYWSSISPNVLNIVDIPDIDDKFRLLMEKVQFLTLERIQDLKYLQFAPCGRGSFCHLTDLYIYRCHNMKSLFSPSCAKACRQLKTLDIGDCSNMEQIIGVGDHCNEEEVVTDEAIMFSQLARIYLHELPQFRSFYPKMEKTTIEESSSNWTTTAKSIFNEKVYFPVLESLTINDLLVEDIWNKKMIESPKGSNKVSFSQLKNMEVIGCHNLVNVFHSNMPQQLQNLETLWVKSCHYLRVLVEDLNHNIQRPAVNFKLNNEFPKLSDLTLYDLPKLKKIWLNDEDYCSNDNSIHLYLQTISIVDCNSLRYAFSAFVARHLARLKSLYVGACPEMEVIISEARGERVTDDGIIEFSQLKSLCLTNLSNLKSFHQSKSEASHLSIHQVIFPKIKSLEIRGLQRLKEIRISNCSQLRSLHVHSMAISLSHLEYLCVGSCEMIEEIIIIEENNINFAGTEKTTSHIEFPKLRELVLCGLRNLKNFCSDKIGSLSFPSLRSIHVENCPKMKTFASGQIYLASGTLQAYIGHGWTKITHLNAPFESRNEDNSHMAIIIDHEQGDD